MFAKLISWIVSIVLLFISTFPGIGIVDTLPISDIEVVESGLGNVLDGNGEWKVFSDYESWKSFAESAQSGDAKTYAESVDPVLFDAYNMAVINVTHPNPDHTTHVTSAEEKSFVLNLQYVVAEETNAFQLTVMTYSTVFVTVSKEVSTVSAKKIAEVQLPFMLADNAHNFRIVSADEKGVEENKETEFIFSDYASWTEFLGNGKWNVGDCADMVNEDFFNENNLALVVSTLPDAGTHARVESVKTNGNVLELKYWEVSDIGVHPDVVCYEAILVAVDKTVDSISVSTDEMMIPFSLDGSFIYT